MSEMPDYGALIELLPILRNCVDGCGEVTLTVEEAAQIRLLGFQAEEGRWKVPPVPPLLAADNPLLENLSIGWNPAQPESTPNRANSRKQSCEVAQIIEGNGRSVLAATQAQGIRQSINVCEQRADPHTAAANGFRPALATTIRQDTQLAVPSQQTANEGDRPSPRRRRAGYQLPLSLQEQDRMAEEAASRIERTLNKAYREGKRMMVRDLQQRHWRFPASVFHQAMRILERRSRILYQFKGIRVTPAHY